ncbi:preprotein translocase subunit SecY [Bacilli bacterium PM5-3]|nr:preprotein translocase subunit SecY [Bacilli bacterium PM5-3]MDH6604204.1 preprotein translocase subunit SecY [Bacilli bacterium PM5-9]
MKRIKSILTNPELKKKVLYTLMILLIFRIGVHISIPGIDVRHLKDATVGSGAGIFEMMNMLGGDALKNYSIFGLGVGPYITASIVIQLLAMDIVPYLSDLQNGGDAGRKKLSQLTRYAAIVLSFAQGYMLTFAFNTQYAIVENPTVVGFVTISLIMTAGALFILWLADQITMKGIGNGTSMIIFAGIVDKVPLSFYKIMKSFFQNPANSTLIATILSIGVLVLFVALVVFTVYTQQATRKIPVQYASNTSKAGETTYLPFKINVAGVIPVIFASAVLMAPATILQLFAKDGNSVVTFLTKLFDYSTPQGLCLYIVLIFAFTYFYANLQVDAKKLTENLGRSGGYIIGIRPGQETMNFVKKTVNKLNFLGASSLAIIAAIPVILPMITNISRNEAYGLGGTGLIIVVGVALEFVNKIDSTSDVKKQKSFIK